MGTTVLVERSLLKQTLVTIDEFEKKSGIPYLEVINGAPCESIREDLLQTYSDNEFGQDKHPRLNYAKKILSDTVYHDELGTLCEYLEKHREYTFLKQDEKGKYILKNITMNMDLYKLSEFIHQWERNHKGGWFKNGCNLLIYYQCSHVKNIKAYKTSKSSQHSKTAREYSKTGNTKKRSFEDNFSHGRLGIIYKIQQKHTGRLYIGQTRQTLYRRVQQHQEATSKIGIAMRQEGVFTFDKQVIMVCAPEDLDKFEVFFIRVYEATSHGNYNCTTGNNSRLYDSEYEDWLQNKDQQLYKKVDDYTYAEQCSFSQMLNDEFHHIAQQSAPTESESVSSSKFTMSKQEIKRSHPDKTDDPNAIETFKKFTAANAKPQEMQP